MRALLKKSPAPGADIADVDVGEVGPSDVKLKIEAASICGTDLGLFDWSEGAQKHSPVVPLIIGHECSARITEVGPDVEGLAVGDRVAMESHIFCGTCAACRRGDAHNCLQMEILGVTRPGVFAEEAVVPGRCCYRVRDGVTAREAALYEPAGVAVHAAELAGAVAGRSVAITGCGPVGMFLVAVLQALDAGSIAVLELNTDRRARAAELGASVFGPEEVADFHRHCAKTGELGGADVGFEVSGAPQAWETMMGTLGKESTVVSVGHPGSPVPLELSNDVNKRGLTMRGVFGRRVWSSWELLDDLVANDKIKLDDFVAAEFELEELMPNLKQIAGLPGKALVFP